MAQQPLHQLPIGAAWVPGAETGQRELPHCLAELEGVPQAVNRAHPADRGNLGLEGFGRGVAHGSNVPVPPGSGSQHAALAQLPLDPVAVGQDIRESGERVAHLRAVPCGAVSVRSFSRKLATTKIRSGSV